MEDGGDHTRPSLLLRLRDTGNAAAWEQFVEVYTPLVHRFLRGKGLQEADACDVAQEVMRTVVRTMPEFVYDPKRGRFRGWLLTMARRKWIDFAKARSRHPDAAGESTLQALIDQEPDLKERSAWEADYHGRLFEWAADQLRPKVQEATWQAFWRTMVLDQDPKQVASELNLSLGGVYVAKSRMLTRLREIIRSVDEEAEALPRDPDEPAAKEPGGPATSD